MKKTPENVVIFQDEKIKRPRDRVRGRRRLSGTKLIVVMPQEEFTVTRIEEVMHELRDYPYDVAVRPLVSKRVSRGALEPYTS